MGPGSPSPGPGTNPGNPGPGAPNPGKPGGGSPSPGTKPGSKSFGVQCTTQTECASKLCVQGPSGPRYCSKNCDPKKTGQCNGGGCKKTNIPGTFVCGKPGSGSGPAPAPPAPGGTPGLNPGGGNKGNGGTKPSPKKDTQPPRVTITAPYSGAKTGTSVFVSAKVTDNVKVKKVELRVDGIVLASATSGPFQFSVKLKPGSRMIRVTGRDTSGLVAHASVRVTVSQSAPGNGSPAPSPPSTNPGTNTQLGGFNDSCSSPDQCQSKLCATDLTLGRSYCTLDCSITACPDGSGCFSSTGGMSICAPLTSSDNGTWEDAYPAAGVAGSGCSVTGQRTAPAALLMLLIGALVLVARRRR